LAINGSVLLNAAIRYVIDRKTEVYLRGENLTNQRTPQIFSADTPGIAVYGGEQVAF
jgi:hypothetical protein